MAYIGRGPTNSGEFIILDDISSGFDGSDTSFTLTVGTTEVTPAAANVTIALDGVIQTATSAYSVTGSTINFTEAPESGQEFHGVLAGQSQYISDSSITNQHISGTANISGSKISTDFGSQNIQIIHVTASGDISVDSMSIPVLSTMSSSVATRFDSRETDMTLATASIALNESNMTLATASIAAITASLGQPVNTDSNVQFADITSTGTITAVEVHTTFVSSSIAVASGSNTFGDDTSDSHQFTGSLSVSGSATIEGSTTLTGTLGVNGSPGEANSKFAVDGNIEMLSGSNRLFIPRASDGALTTSIFSRTGNNLTLSGAGSSGGQVEFIPSSANSSAITLTIESSGRMVASSVLSAGQDHLDGDASLYLANAGSDGTMIKFGDTNAGLVYGGSGTGTFKLMQRENTAVFIDSSRRVGIGDTSPGSPLDVKSGEAANTANFNSTNGATNITFESNGSLIGQMEWSGPGPSQIVTRTSASLALGSNNVKTLYVTDDDRVGIGAASPLSKLDVRNTTETIALNSSAGAIFESEPPDANNGTYLFGDGSGDSDRVQILAVNSDDTIAAGNWSGIGFGVKTNSSSNTIVNLAGVAGIKETSTDGSGGDVGALAFGTRATGDYIKERMRITSDGNVGIGTTSPTAFYPCLQIEGTQPAIIINDNNSDAFWTMIADGGNSNLYFDHSGAVRFLTATNNGGSSGTVAFQFNNDGTAEKSSGAGDWASTSDVRLKKNVEDLNIDALNVLNTLRPVEFNWKNEELHNNPKDSNGKSYGFLADEIETVMPQLVTTSKITSGSADTEYLDEDKMAKKTELGTMASLYIKAIQQLTEKNEALEKRIEELEKD